jgi:integrase
MDDLHNRADALGLPLQVNTIGDRELARLIKAAGVRGIKFHGLRHTVATLMLSAGVPAHVVQRRLGHSKVEMTLGIYAHVLPSRLTPLGAAMSKVRRHIPRSHHGGEDNNDDESN